MFASCPWEKKKKFWHVASLAMARAMYDAKKDKIVIAARKELKGDRSIYNSILYKTELVGIGTLMSHHPE